MENKPQRNWGIWLSVGIIAFVIAIITGIVLSNPSTYTSNNRPKHCIGDECADSSVFSELPEYPENLREVALAVELSAFGMPENFSNKYPDENYYKQPEFYPDEMFVKQGLKYYIDNSLRFSIGSGGYPSDVLISNMANEDLIHINDTVRAIIYWHTGYAVWKYQVFKLVPTFPNNMSMRMETYKLEQNPQVAERCLDVKITPDNIILDPTYPSFGYEWVQKVEAEITVKCKGKFGLQVTSASADQWFYADMVRKYGLNKISNSISGQTWQIFVEVQ